eukprot:gene22593-biopygen11760
MPAGAPRTPPPGRAGPPGVLDPPAQPARRPPGIANSARARGLGSQWRKRIPAHKAALRQMHWAPELAGAVWTQKVDPPICFARCEANKTTFRDHPPAANNEENRRHPSRTPILAYWGAGQLPRGIAGGPSGARRGAVRDPPGIRRTPPGPRRGPVGGPSGPAGGPSGARQIATGLRRAWPGARRCSSATSWAPSVSAGAPQELQWENLHPCAICVPTRQYLQG